MASRSHLSIGEVLSLVQEDFPDVTISKIRFLESQGLLDPERTPSGYRKFYKEDIERLQWILTQQRDNFLPLKVIRERLDEWDATGAPPDGVGEGSDDGAASDGRPEQTDGIGAAPQTRSPDASADVDRDIPGFDEIASTPEDDPRRAAASLAASSAMEVVSNQPTPQPVAPVSDATPALEPQTSVQPAAPGPDSGTADDLRVGPTSTSLTAEELAEQCGVEPAVVHELESYAMISSRRLGAESYFEPDAAVVVRACRRFLDHGIEVRHLRMYKIAAEREAGVFEQLVMPLLKQRNPEARARAIDTVRALADAGEDLHAALLRHVLSDTLPDR